MDTSMLTEIDVIDGHLHGCEKRIRDMGGVAREGDDDPIVIAVRIYIEEVCQRSGASERGDDFATSAFGEIWDRFEQRMCAHAPVSLRAHARTGRARLRRGAHEASPL